MSALRTMLAALWAAVWVRWKLLSVRARRTFDGGDPAAAVSSYYLSASEIPVEGVDYDLAELPPDLAAGLEASRRELSSRAGTSSAIPARQPRARRRRTVSVAVASLLALGVAGAGASALVTGTTGVPAVDRLLGIYEQNRPGGGLQPDPAAGSTSVEISTGDGRRVVSTSYFAKDGRVCTAITDAEPGRPGGVGCVELSVLAEGLEQRAGLLAMVGENGDGTLLSGFVRRDVVRIEASGPDGNIRTKLGAEWSSTPAGVDPLKPFIAISGRRPGRQVTRQDYEIYAVTETGERFRIAP